ncbi:hypothetical protein ACLOJK_004152 [Asimina triloba]
MSNVPSWIYDQRLGFALLATASIRLFDANEHAACWIADCPDLQDALETVFVDLLLCVTCDVCLLRVAMDGAP